jgi:hypothetical protein
MIFVVGEGHRWIEALALIIHGGAEVGVVV